MLSETTGGFYPADRRCPVCGGDFSKGVAYLSGGGLLLSKDGQNSIHLTRLKGFMHVGFHGKDPAMRDSADVTVVDDVTDGQFDLQWCSIQCMREWLSHLLDEVEARIGREDTDV